MEIQHKTIHCKWNKSYKENADGAMRLNQVKSGSLPQNVKTEMKSEEILGGKWIKMLVVQELKKALGWSLEWGRASYMMRSEIQVCRTATGMVVIYTLQTNQDTFQSEMGFY